MAWVMDSWKSLRVQLGMQGKKVQFVCESESEREREREKEKKQRQKRVKTNNRTHKVITEKYLQN